MITPVLRRSDTALLRTWRGAIKEEGDDDDRDGDDDVELLIMTMIDNYDDDEDDVSRSHTLAWRDSKKEEADAIMVTVISTIGMSRQTLQNTGSDKVWKRKKMQSTSLSFTKCSK